MTLFELSQDYKNFLQAIEDGLIPEDAINDSLESISGLIEDKADNIACMIKNLNAEALAIKTEEQALAERRKAKEKQVERLKEYLSETLLSVNYTKIETARNKISFRKSESVYIANEEEFIEWCTKEHDDFLTYKAPTLNKTMIKSALASGEVIEGASIVSKQNMQIK
jgi:ubiquinone biosynthesis protein Coq4